MLQAMLPQQLGTRAAVAFGIVGAAIAAAAYKWTLRRAAPPVPQQLGTGAAVALGVFGAAAAAAAYKWGLAKAAPPKTAPSEDIIIGMSLLTSWKPNSHTRQPEPASITDCNSFAHPTLIESILPNFEESTGPSTLPNACHWKCKLAVWLTR